MVARLGWNMKKGKTLVEVFAKEEQKPQKGRFNVAGQVITHPKLDGEWLIVATQMAGGSSGEGMSGHDCYPDGYEIVLREVLSYSGMIPEIDWKKKEKRFYQSGCFNDESMLQNPEVVWDLRK